MRLIQINEKQYNELILNEELHYPKFLDELKTTISTQVHKRLEEEISKGNTIFNFTLQVKCEYTNNITFHVEIDKNGNFKNNKEYQCFYYNKNNQLCNGKLVNPKILIYCPSINNKIMFPLLNVVLSHELTHLYDDWNRLVRGENGINYIPKNIETTQLVNKTLQMDNDLYKSLSMLGYMSLNVERQAFLSQTVQELESIGCTLSNYKEKLKETNIYNNIIKSYNLLVKCLNQSTDFDLQSFNTFIITTYPKANIPKINIGDYNFEEYKNKVLMWANNVFHKTMKKYGSVVMYYVNQLKENRLSDIFIL